MAADGGTSASAGDTMIELTEDFLDVGQIVDSVKTSKCGAVSVFVGTTRDHHEGRRVMHLRYEAYVPMAKKRLLEIGQEMRVRWPTISRIALVHRLGTVPIKEASVVVAVSSPHRKESLEAVAFAIDQLKSDVPIWKKEEYQDGGAEWKTNRECAWAKEAEEGGALQQPQLLAPP